MISESKIIHGLALETVKTFGSESVDCVITSPPYFQLRDYGFPEQWGLEPTYQEYLEHLWSLFDEIHRVLKPGGTCWVNLGDSFSGAAGGLWDKDPNPGSCNAIARIKKQATVNYPPKCLLLIPHRFAIGMIERNWILRNDIIWAKPNGMPESVTDRFSKKHEFIFFFVKQQKYYFDLDAIRKPLKESSIQLLSQPNIENQAGSERIPGKTNGNMKAVGGTKISKSDCENYGSPRAGNQRDGASVSEGHFLGSNPGDVSDFWDITTKPSLAKHYATFNSELIDKPLIAGCPEGGIVLDPFCGTATTVARAIQLGRTGIGIDGSSEYVKTARKNIAQSLSAIDLFRSNKGEV